MAKVQILIIFASIQSDLERHSQGSKMCAIDFPHKVTPREVISKEKKLKNFFEKNSR
jgi:hypothetical protein